MKRSGQTNRCAWTRSLCPIVVAIGAALISITICCVPFARGQQSARGKQKAHVKKNAISVNDDQKTISDAGNAAPNLTTINYETIELDHRQKVRVEKWGDTFEAYEYRPPVDLNDPSVEEVIWYKDLGEGRGGGGGPHGLAIDPQNGHLYWAHASGGLTDGKIVRSTLDGKHVTYLVEGLAYPRDLVLDVKRRRMYWLEGLNQKHALRVADFNGGDLQTLVQGLNYPRGLALDTEREELFYWERPGRIVRVKTDGTGETEILDKTDDEALHLWVRGMFWNPRDHKLYWMNPTGKLRRLAAGAVSAEDLCNADLHLDPGGFALDLASSQVIAADAGSGGQLVRLAVNGAEREVMAISTSSKNVSWKSIQTLTAMDQQNGWVYWSGNHPVGSQPFAAIYRMKLLPRFSRRVVPAPPLITSIAPFAVKQGEALTISGRFLKQAKAVTIVDDSSFEHTSAEFIADSDHMLRVTMPILSEQALHPQIIVETQSGVTMVLRKDINVLTPHSHYEHDRFHSAALPQFWMLADSMASKLENAILYANAHAHFQPGPKGHLFVFVKNDCFCSLLESPHCVVYHEPFSRWGKLNEWDRTTKLHAVSAIRPSFLEDILTYRH